MLSSLQLFLAHDDRMYISGRHIFSGRKLDQCWLGYYDSIVVHCGYGLLSARRNETSKDDKDPSALGSGAIILDSLLSIGCVLLLFQVEFLIPSRLSSHGVWFRHHECFFNDCFGSRHVGSHWTLYKNRIGLRRSCSLGQEKQFSDESIISESFHLLGTLRFVPWSTIYSTMARLGITATGLFIGASLYSTLCMVQLWISKEMSVWGQVVMHRNLR